MLLSVIQRFHVALVLGSNEKISGTLLDSITVMAVAGAGEAKRSSACDCSLCALEAEVYACSLYC